MVWDGSPRRIASRAPRRRWHMFIAGMGGLIHMIPTPLGIAGLFDPMLSAVFSRCFDDTDRFDKEGRAEDCFLRYVLPEAVRKVYKRTPHR